MLNDLINRLTTIALFALSAALFASHSHAASSTWTVSNGENTLYIGGTFHMLKPTDYPLPKEFEQAYQKADWLVFETDISKLGSADFNKQFINAMKLPSGQILADTLSPKAYAELIYYAAKNNIDIGQFQHFKPQLVALIISLRELKKLGLSAQGVDTYFGKKAAEDNKTMSELETLDEQINYIATLSEGNESALMLQTIEDFVKLPNELEQLTHAWRSGDIEQLNEIGIKPISKDYPKVYQSLIVERNQRWLPKIEQLLQQPGKKFILVGAMHLAGKDGLLEQLALKGYQVEAF